MASLSGGFFKQRVIRGEPVLQVFQFDDEDLHRRGLLDRVAPVTVERRFHARPDEQGRARLSANPLRRPVQQVGGALDHLARGVREQVDGVLHVTAGVFAGRVPREAPVS